MSRSFLRPLIVAVLLSLSFSSLSQAAEHRLRERTWRIDLLKVAIELLIKHGCGLDPHGICLASPPKRGCTIDPNGGCLPAPSTSTIDTERGCGIDPHGACNGG